MIRARHLDDLYSRRWAPLLIELCSQSRQHLLVRGEYFFGEIEWHLEDFFIVAFDSGSPSAFRAEPVITGVSSPGKS